MHGPVHRITQRGRSQSAVTEQDLDQRPGAGGVTELAAGSVPVALMAGRERAHGAGLSQRRRSGQRAGLVPQHVQVVVQDQYLGVLPGGPFMRGDGPRPVEGLHRPSRQPHRHPPPGIPGRHGVVVLPHADPGPAIHPRGQQPRRVEHLPGQRQHRRLLGRERRRDSDRPAGDHPPVVENVSRGDQLVQSGQRDHRRDRHQVTAAEPADLTLDAAFLMRPLRAGDAKERVEPVMAAQRDEPLGLGPVPALQHPGDRGLEVVVADPARHGAEMLERQHVAFQERFLRLGGERNMKRPPRARQPQHEQPQLQHGAGDHRVELAEVDLGFGPGQMRLRHRNIHVLEAELGAAASHIPRHAHLRAGSTVLGDQPLPHPAGGVPLLPRHLPVGQQPSVDNRRVVVDGWPCPWRIRLAGRRHRRLQRLPHRPPVHVMTIGQFPDRGAPDPAVLPDLLEQLHS